MTKHIPFFALLALATTACESQQVGQIDGEFPLSNDESPLNFEPLYEADPEFEMADDFGGSEDPDASQGPDVWEETGPYVVGTPYVEGTNLVVDVVFSASCEVPRVELDVDAIYLSNPAIAEAFLSVSSPCETLDNKQETQVVLSILDALPIGACAGQMRVHFGPPNDYEVYTFSQRLCGLHQ